MKIANEIEYLFFEHLFFEHGYLIHYSYFMHEILFRTFLMSEVCLKIVI